MERFHVMVHDRLTGRRQTYDTDRLVAAYCLPDDEHPGNQAWIASFRATSAEQIGTAIAMIIAQAMTIDPAILQYIAPALSRIPPRTRTIDYAAGDTPQVTFHDTDEKMRG